MVRGQRPCQLKCARKLQYIACHASLAEPLHHIAWGANKNPDIAPGGTQSSYARIELIDVILEFGRFSRIEPVRRRER
jgi:hypothetical protein